MISMWQARSALRAMYNFFYSSYFYRDIFSLPYGKNALLFSLGIVSCTTGLSIAHDFKLLGKLSYMNKYF